MKWLRTKIQELLFLLKKLLREGVTPSKLSLTLALGVSIGIIPVMGVNTLLLLVLALIFRLNVPLIQLVNYVAYPLQLMLYIPFLKVGATLLAGTKMTLSKDYIWGVFKEGWLSFFNKLGEVHLYGLVVWFTLLLPITVAIYVSSYKMFADYRRNKTNSFLDKLFFLKGNVHKC
jgi:uncharacterized protein (DUF2062 family)